MMQHLSLCYDQSVYLQAERFIDGCAFVHELDGAAGVSGDVRDGDESAGQLGRALRHRDPGGVGRGDQRLGVRDGDQARGLGRPVDA